MPELAAALLNSFKVLDNETEQMETESLSASLKKDRRLETLQKTVASDSRYGREGSIQIEPLANSIVEYWKIYHVQEGFIQVKR